MASVPEKTASIFDVLYADTRRLSSLLSQFSDDGIVTELVRMAGEETSTHLGLSIKVFKTNAADKAGESTSRKVDPQWLLPLLFLDASQDLIRRDIEGAPIGSLVLVTGRLAVTDLSFLQEMWKNPALKRFIQAQMASDEAEGNRAARRSAQSQQKNKPTEGELALELLPLLPHSPQFNIVTEERAVWSTIDPQYLVGTVSDLVLKHGAKVAGSWSMVGVLDGRPFEERGDGDYDEIFTPMEQVRLGLGSESVWKVATELQPAIRQALGRPYFSFGVTPLIIFREVEQP